jgi:hypothetical protein
MLTFVSAPSFAQKSGKKPKAKKSEQSIAATNNAAKYYRIAGLGSSEGDSTNAFPYPTAVLQLLDTVNTKVVVRFPELGMLGIQEDTVTEPAFTAGDSIKGYTPPDPLYMLTFPKTEYILFVDVWSKDGKTLLDSKPLAYDMFVEKYKTAHLTYVHEPTAGLGSLTLRREFKPTLLPFTIETNPGWGSTETLDSNSVYALVFRDPQHPDKLEMSVTMRPAMIGNVDSAMWKNFKSKAEIAFGSKGIATRSIGDFQIADSATRRYIKAGYEFVSKSRDSSMEYVAAFLTPRAILMLLAPMDAPNQQLQFQYFQAIARSFKLD